MCIHMYVCSGKLRAARNQLQTQDRAWRLLSLLLSSLYIYIYIYLCMCLLLYICLWCPACGRPEQEGTSSIRHSAIRHSAIRHSAISGIRPFEHSGIFVIRAFGHFCNSASHMLEISRVGFALGVGFRQPSARLRIHEIVYDSVSLPVYIYK